MKIFAISFLLSFLATPVLAKNYALLFSGVDTEKKDKNQFFKEYQERLGVFTKGGWETQILYGEPTETDYFLKHTPAAKGKVKNASRENIMAYLDEIIKNGQSGDQLLLNMNGHGSLDQSFEIQGKLLSYSDEEFLGKLKALNEKGVKLAFAMDTCFGGGAVRPLTPYACIVASQTNNMVSYGGPVMNTLKKVLKATTPQNMNDYYLTLLAEATNAPRMVPVHSGAYDDDYLARIFTGFFRKESQYPSAPHESCYGPEAMVNFENGVSTILATMNAQEKYKKVCKLFGVSTCKKQADVLASLKKLKLSDLDTQTASLEELSNEKMKFMDQCFEAHDESFNKSFSLKIDFKNLTVLPNESHLGLMMPFDFKEKSPDIKFEDGLRTGTTLTIPFKGHFCSIPQFLSSDSINDLSNYFAKTYYDGPNKTFKATSMTQLAAKIKTELTKSFSKVLSPEQKLKVASQADHVKAKYAADKKYHDKLSKIHESYRDVDNGMIQQALAYRFLDGSENISEKDKANRKKCEDFKLK